MGNVKRLINYKIIQIIYEKLDFVRSGRYIDFINNPDVNYKDIESVLKKLYIYKLICSLFQIYGPSRHFTIIFNAYVWMQIFNFFNSRRINDEKNIFEGKRN